MIPPVGWKEQWRVGEYQKWLRIETPPGTPMLWVLYPKKQGEPEPKFESLNNGTSVRVTLGNETDEITIADGKAKITQAGKETVLLTGN